MNDRGANDQGTGADSSLTRRRALGAMALGVVGVSVAACSTGNDGASGKSTPQPPVASLSFTPRADAGDVNPNTDAAVRVDRGTLGRDVKLVNDAGKAVPGTMSRDRKSFVVTEPLGYGRTYTWSGTATGTDGKKVPLAGAFTTVKPASTTGVVVNIADGQSVGIAAPLMLTFDSIVKDKAAVEKVMKVTTTPETEGSWAWLAEDSGSRAHWRPREYWRPGTKVSMDARFYGVDYGDGAYGAADVTSDFVIGRSQIVKAVASSHQIQVVTDGAVSMTLPCSYGQGDIPRNVTRSGIHVVSEKWEDFLMSNPAAGYFNLRERFAVRISNNGEFIHANPETVGVQGSSNVTNGCINLSLADAQRYFATAVYGDPVEVTGTSIELSAADGDIYDWTIDWPTWKSLSALADDSSAGQGGGAATPTDAPQLEGTPTTSTPKSQQPVG